MHRPTAFGATLQHLGSVAPTALVMFGAISGGLLALLQLVSEVREGETKRFDEAILLAFRHTGDLQATIGPAWLAHAANDITSLGGVTVLSLVTLLATGYLLTARRCALAGFLFVSVLSGWMLSTTLKLLIARERPDIVPHLVDINDFSFPSGHAMLSAITYLTLAGLLAREQSDNSVRIFIVIVSVLLTMMIGVSRVFLGVHYPTDVLGGWCAGATWALFCWFVSKPFLSRSDTTKSQS